MNSTTKIWLGVSVGVVLLGIIAFFVFFYQARLAVTADPSTAQITVNGQSISNSKVVKLSPGTYTINISATNYLPSTKTVKLSIGQVVKQNVTLNKIPEPIKYTSEVSYPVFSSDNQAVLYLGNSGKQFFKVNKNLNSNSQPTIIPITQEKFQNITNVVWAPDRATMIYQTSDGATKLYDFKRYDVLNQTETDLDTGLRAITWSPNGTQIIAFRSLPDGTRSLIRRTLLTNQVDILADLRSYNFTNPKLVWSPNGEQVVIIEQNAYLFTVNTRQIKQISTTSDIDNGNWSPNSQSILVTTKNGLVWYNLADNKFTPLNIQTTISQTAWFANNQQIIAAVLSDTTDKLSVITLPGATQQTAVYNSTQRLDIANILIDITQNKIWFTSGGQLYSLELAISA